jgi:hypothetical protein
MGGQSRRRFRELKLRTYFLDLRNSLLQLCGQVDGVLHFLYLAMFLQTFIEQDRVPSPNAVPGRPIERLSFRKRISSGAKERLSHFSMLALGSFAFAIATAIDVRVHSASVRTDGF